MPRIFLDAVANDTSQDWEVYGTTLPAWQAINHTSPDSTGIRTSRRGISSFVSATASLPGAGTVTSLTLHIRVRRPLPSTGGIFFAHMDLNGSPTEIGGPFVPTADWQDLEIRVRTDRGGRRFVASDLIDLKFFLQVTVDPTGGYIEVSRLWFELEWIPLPLSYDPCCGNTPDTLLGDLNWLTSGGIAASITDQYLVIPDGSMVDNREYAWQTPVPLSFPESWSSDIESRFVVTSSSGDGPLVTISGIADQDRSIDLTLVTQSGRYYVGLCSIDLDHRYPGQYFSVAEIPNPVGTDLHFLLRVIRSANPANPGRVSVYQNYSQSPLLEVPLGHFRPEARPVIINKAFFGTWIGTECTVKFDFLSCFSYKTAGDVFPSWKELGGGGNSITIEVEDPYLVPIQNLPFLPVQIGQSNSACKFVVTDSSNPCGIEQSIVLSPRSTNTLDIEYRTQAAPATPLAVVVQRLDELTYWDDSTRTWSLTLVEVPLPAALTRTRVRALSNLSPVGTTPLLLSIRKHSSAVGTFDSWVYAALLKRV